MSTHEQPHLALQRADQQILIALAAVSVCVLAAFMGPLAIVIAALPLALWMAVSFPLTWMAGFIALSQYRLPDAIPPLNSLHLPLAFGALSLVGLVWHVALARSLQVKWRIELKLMLVLLALSFVGLPFAIDKRETWYLISNTYWKIIAASFAIAWLTRKERDFGLLARVALGCGIIIGVVALYNKYNGINLVEGTRVGIGAALGSPLADPNDLALVLMCPMSMAMAFLVMRVSRGLTIFAAATLIFTLLAVIATQSRGGLLSVLGAMSVLGVHVIRSRKTLFLLIGLVGVVLFVVMGIGVRKSGGYAELAEGGLDESSWLRTLAWTAALNIAVARPLTGVGLGGFASSFYFYTPIWVQRNMAPHSSWFGMLGEMGIPGLLALFGMIGFAFLSAQRAQTTLERLGAPLFMRAMALGLKASIVSFCVGGSFLGHHSSWPLYTIVAMAAALGNYASAFAASADRDSIATTRDPRHATPIGRTHEPTAS